MNCGVLNYHRLILCLREIILGFHLAGKEVVATVVPQPDQDLFKVSMELSGKRTWMLLSAIFMPRVLEPSKSAMVAIPEGLP